MSKVYITQENPRIDFSAAEDHGSIVFVTAREFLSANGSETNAMILSQMKEKLRNFDPESDSVLLSGNPIFMMHVITHLTVNMGFEAIRLLHWNGQTRRYSKYILNPQNS